MGKAILLRINYAMDFTFEISTNDWSLTEAIDNNVVKPAEQTGPSLAEVTLWQRRQ
jgi:hypothetical protein